jgi:uncharacterized LabA/DUF88 family protein
MPAAAPAAPPALPIRRETFLLSTTRDRTPILAVFCDFENVALGVRDAKYKRFDIRKVLERLLLKGSIVVKKAYCDWDRYKAYKPAMHEAAFELIDIPHVRQSGKNSADIRLVVDALDLCYTKHHVNTFAIISGDSDFSPLVSKLRENDKVVIGVGVANSSSDLLIANCDEFIYYDDLVRAESTRKTTGSRSRTQDEETIAEPATAEAPPAAQESPAPRRRSSRRGGRGKSARGPEEVAGITSGEQAQNGQQAPAEEPEGDASEDQARKGLDLVCETVAALAEELGDEQKIWGSMVKQTLRRRRPGFNESFYGFRSFNAMLEEARRRGLLALEKDQKSGGYIVELAERPAGNGDLIGTAHAEMSDDAIAQPAEESDALAIEDTENDDDERSWNR